MTALSGSLCRRWKCELQSTRRSLASHSTKASGMVSMASRRRRSASTVRSARLFCSVMSTAMPIRCTLESVAPRVFSQRTRSQIQWPSTCCMRKVWSIWSIFSEMSWSAISNRSMSSDFTSALTSPKVRSSLRPSRPSIENIDCDQKIRPRDRSQSHRPQRPRLSAVSMRPRTASLMRSPSRARVDCQWKAKPRIRTTKPVVADSVTDSAASEPQIGSLRSWITVTRPGSDLICREVTIAALPFGRVMSDTWLSRGGAASSCAVVIASSRRSLPEGSRSIGMRARMRRSTPAEVTTTWRPEAVPQDGMRSGSSVGRFSMFLSRSCREEVRRSIRSASRSASAEMSWRSTCRFWRV
ncbi:hypothetical protein ABIF64_004442 [Bradyrhizobium japonicum]